MFDEMFTSFGRDGFVQSELHLITFLCPQNNLFICSFSAKRNQNKWRQSARKNSRNKKVCSGVAF